MNGNMQMRIIEKKKPNNMQRFLLICITLWCLGEVNAQIVSTQFGQIQGNTNGTVHQFLGIPFAKAPIDSLRWKAPINPNNWSDTLTTTNFAPVCPQKSYTQGDTTYTLEGNEDCLYLNVWTPQLGSSSLPVLVFIHGGGNQQGGASETNGGTQLFFGKNMSARGNAVVVTIQYRLGPLGYLAHPGLEPENSNSKSGNYAVLDQLLALTWVQNNIANFGGDPSKVMIFGESAGGLNVGNLLTTSLANGLFQRACIQSAAPIINDYSTSRDSGTAWVNKYISTGTAVQKIAYMRTLSSDSLLHYLSSPLAGGVVQMNWQPVVDGTIFTDHPLQIFQSGNFNKVPLIVGSNAEEMSLQVPQTVLPIMVNALINSKIPLAYQPQAHALYPAADNAEARKSYIEILSDAQFTVSTRRTAQCVSLNQTAPVWRYFFSHKHTIPQLSSFGSYHGMELFYVFNTWENATLGSGPFFKPADDSVQNAMLHYWVNFAATGNPNGTGLVNWPQYQSSTDCYLEIKATPNGTQCGLRTAESDLWDNISGFAGCSSSVGVENIFNETSFTVFPNPTLGNLQIEPSTDNLAYEINVYNSLGQKVDCRLLNHQIDLTTAANGIYIIAIKTAEKMYYKKVIKTE